MDKIRLEETVLAIEVSSFNFIATILMKINTK